MRLFAIIRRVLFLRGVVLLLFFMAGCTNVESETLSQQAGVEEVHILWEKSGTYSRLTRSIRIVVRGHSTLAQIPLAEVDVDFDTQMLLIAGLGPTTGGGRGIRITRVWREGLQIRTQERQVNSAFNRMTVIHHCSPWTIVAIPRSDLNVEGYSGRVPKDLLGEHPDG
ncbi:MAG: hypothetical protein JSV03_17210 [Planctomycetota bacterium]|nr:MAG: hypothetical protein JSV03_17210 [Planctomycetota bacterium]